MEKCETVIGKLIRNSPTSIESLSAHQQHSLIEPFLENLSGSGSQNEGVIFGQDFVQLNTDFDNSAITAEKHLVVISARNPATLKWRIEEWMTNGSIEASLSSEDDATDNLRWDTKFEMLLLAIDPTFVSQTVAEVDCSDSVELAPHFRFKDALLEQLMHTLSTELEKDLSSNRFYIESLTRTLIVHLLSQQSVSELKQPDASNGLSPKNLALVRDYIDTHINKPLSLKIIADIVNISPSHFMRLFKQSTGSTPYQYVIAQRIKKAKALLSETAVPISYIADQTGFADQSHLTRLMRRHTGLTPKNTRDR